MPADIRAAARPEPPILVGAPPEPARRRQDYKIPSWALKVAAAITGIVADKAWAAKNPKFMEAFAKVLAKSYANYKANGASWTAETPEVKGIVKMIGGNEADTIEALGLLGFPTVEEQASNRWLGGGAESGAVKAFTASASFLKDQKQLDSVLDDYEPFVNGSYAAAAQ